MASVRRGHQLTRHVSEVSLGLVARLMDIVVIHPTTVPTSHVRVLSEVVRKHPRSALMDYAVPSLRSTPPARVVHSGTVIRLTDIVGARRTTVLILAVKQHLALVTLLL